MASARAEGLHGRFPPLVFLWLMLPRLPALLLCTLMTACASSDQADTADANTTVSYDHLENLAAERYGADAAVVYEPNTPTTYVLVQHRTASTAQNPLVTTSYFVYATEAEKVIFEEQGLQGTAEWHDDRYVRVHLTPGTVPATGSYSTTYYVDVQKGERMREDEVEKDGG